MKFPSPREIATEAKLLLIGIPVLIWTLLPIYHLFLFAISPKESAFSGKLWPDNPTLHNFGVVFRQEHFYLHHFWQQFWNSLVIAVATGVITLLIATVGGLRDQPAQGEGRARDHEPRAVHLFHSGGVPRRADVPHDGPLRPAQQPVGADPRDGDDRGARTRSGC